MIPSSDAQRWTACKKKLALSRTREPSLLLGCKAIARSPAGRRVASEVEEEGEEEREYNILYDFLKGHF
jgi:hypothetical protein